MNKDMICFAWTTIDWIALISAVATMGMAVATFCTIRQSRKQFKETRSQWETTNQQWEEENRAILVFRIVLKYDLWCIEVSNVGNRSAHEIYFKPDESFVKALLLPEMQERIKEVKYPLLKVNETKFFPFALSENFRDGVHTPKQIKDSLERIEQFPIEINGNYLNYTKKAKIQINETFSLKREDRSYAMLINDPLETLANSIEDIKTKCISQKPERKQH